MPNAARKGDLTAHGGMIVQGSPNVSIGYMPAARLLDRHVCPIHGPGPVTQTSFTVFINGVGAARVMDKCTCMVPAKGKGGGSQDKPKHAEFKAGMEGEKEKKWREKDKEWEKDGKEPWKKKDAEPEPEQEGFKPKYTAEVSKEFGEFGNEDDKKGVFETNIYGGKGEAKAGVEVENLRNAKAEAGAKYEVEYTGARLKGEGQLGDAGTKGWEAKGDAEAKLLTAKAEAGAGGKLEVKDGKLEAAYVEAEAGAGGSVLEGSASGSAGFKLPFVNYKISFGGEVSGALLTAEAKASAHAGYKDHKWSFGFGAKIGAALAGLGVKFNVSLEKIDPPEPPPPAAGIPGVAGIDPIVKGCMTVCIGGSPPPYVPGPPPPAPPPAVALDGLGKRNSPKELTLAAAKRSGAAFAPIKCPW
jgi:uncharacterized Zn-binding protein involved in type VI secretion